MHNSKKKNKIREKKREKNAEIQLKTKQANKFLTILTLISLVIEIVILIKWRDLKVLTYVQFLIILILLYSFFHFKELLLVENKTASFFSQGLLVMVIASSSLSLPVRHYNLTDNHALWMIIWPVFGILMLLFIVGIWSFPLTIEKCVQFILCYGLLLLGAGYGLVKYTNVIMDDSIPVRHHSTILEKRIVQSKSPSYLVTLSGWDNNVSPQEIDVDDKRYKQMEIGQEVNVDVYPGRLNIPWFQLIKE